VHSRARRVVAAGVVAATFGGGGFLLVGGGAVSSASPHDGGQQNHDVTLVLTPTAGGTTTSLGISSYDFTEAVAANIGSQSSGAGAGKVTFNPLVVTVPLGEAAASALATGSSDTFASAQLTVPGAHGQDALNVTFGLVKLDQVEWASTGGGTETLTFEYGGLTFAPQGPTTPSTSGG